MKKYIVTAFAAVAMAGAIAMPAKANPAVVAPSWVVVATAVVVVGGMVALAAVAKQRGCHWANARDVNGVTKSIYVCG